MMRAPDLSKSTVVQETRAMAAKISPTSARRLRERLLHLQLTLIADLVESDAVNMQAVIGISHIRNCMEVVELLAGDLRVRP
jgi:hypothetical protein